jgi:hypothetical protein
MMGFGSKFDRQGMPRIVVGQEWSDVDEAVGGHPSLVFLAEPGPV